jgi:hypothetical protein
MPGAAQAAMQEGEIEYFKIEKRESKKCELCLALLHSLHCHHRQTCWTPYETLVALESPISAPP